MSSTHSRRELFSPVDVTDRWTSPDSTGPILVMRLVAATGSEFIDAHAVRQCDGADARRRHEFGSRSTITAQHLHPGEGHPLGVALPVDQLVEYVPGGQRKVARDGEVDIRHVSGLSLAVSGRRRTVSAVDHDLAVPDRRSQDGEWRRRFAHRDESARPFRGLDAGDARSPVEVFPEQTSKRELCQGQVMTPSSYPPAGRD